MREYRTPEGVIRVLRRPEQINSLGHRRTLRRLPTSDQHPPDDVDIDVSNEQELKVGTTGDLIDVESLNGYARPVGDISVSRLSTIAKMVDAETWAKVLEEYPAARSVERLVSEPQTGTSLGYNALWWSPHVESEIVGEDPDGGLIGEWAGPHGPERYNIEHIVDPECEIVQRLVRDQSFNAGKLGGNHFAVALRKLGGRGAQQSELMRIVDSAEVIADPIARSRVSVGVRVPCGERDAVKWTVGTDRDLPISEDGAWDGDAAKASVFAWAGWPDNPDPAQARRAFLIYDAESPELKGSYKLPIAHYGDRLEVSAEGLRAAASRLPQTDAPQDVLDRARDVLDHYFEKLGAAASTDRDNMPNATPEKVQVVDIGYSRDAAAKLSKRGINTPAALSLTFDMIEGPQVVEALRGMAATLAELLEALESSEAGKTEAEGKVAEMEDMVSAEEAKKMVAAVKTELAKAEEALAAATKAESEAKATSDSLLAELTPLREEKFKTFKDSMLAAGVDESVVKDCEDAASLRRAVMVDKLGERFAVGKATDAVVEVAFDVYAELRPAAETGAKETPAPKGSSFSNMPEVKIGNGRDSKDEEEAPETSTADQMDAGMTAVFG